MAQSSDTLRLVALAAYASLVGFGSMTHPSKTEARSQAIVLDDSDDWGGLTQALDGATQAGGRLSCAGQWGNRLGQYSGCGTIFRIRPDGRADTLYYFHGGQAGAGPQGLGVAPKRSA
jgi:hypothetical protein